MLFRITLSNKKTKTIKCESVRYADAPGFVLFVKDDETVVSYNTSKIESIETLKEPK